MRKKTKRIAAFMVIALLAANTQTYKTNALAKVSTPLQTMKISETLPKTSSLGAIGIIDDTTIDIPLISTTGSAINNTPVPSTGSAINNSPVPSTGSAINNSPVPSTGSAINNSPVPSTGSAINNSPVPSTGSAIYNSPVPSTGSAIDNSPIPSTGSVVNNSPVPSSGPAIDSTPMPSVKPADETPLPTTTPDETTPVPSPTVKPPEAYKKGAVFQRNNYKYTVVKAPTKTTAGQVYVKQVASIALQKKSLTVPSSFTIDGFTYEVIGITKEAFMSCTALQTVTIKSGTTFIGQRAFRGVSTLKTVILPDTVTTIKSGAFRGCTELRQITLPSNVTTIRLNAFCDCTKLKAVMVLSKSLATLGKNAFKNTKSGCYMIVLSGKKSAYRTLLDSSGAKKVILYTY